jgi:hypothetical protein
MPIARSTQDAMHMREALDIWLELDAVRLAQRIHPCYFSLVVIAVHPTESGVFIKDVAVLPVQLQDVVFIGR